jgi:4-hydroxybenzoate polyprenyltransferase
MAMRLHELPVIYRVEGWWEFKFGPILALVYATALIGGVSLAAHWPSLVAIVVALTAVGACANVLNDWTDIQEDRACGKTNRLAGKPWWMPPLLVVVTGAIGCIALWLLRPGRAGIVLYATDALVFFLYSVPPFRFKTRGLPGILADAAAAHTLPALFAVVSFSTVVGDWPSPSWLAIIVVWSLMYGLRGILWHQLADYENDRRTGGFTFVCRQGPGLARRLGEWVAFPLEIVALAGLLWRTSLWPVILLVCDSWLIWLRKVYHYATTIIVAPRERFRIALHEFNYAILPVALLVVATFRHPADGLVLAVHVLLFPVGLKGWARDLGGLTLRWARETATGVRS